MLRSLIHYWRVNLAVLLGAAVGAAVLAGALLVGDSVRGSLRDLTLERLGRVDLALTANRFFRQELAADLEDAPAFATAAPIILLRGSAVHGDTRARASGVAILGIDHKFTELFPASALDLARKPGQLFPSVVLNAGLARELGAGRGDPVVLSLPRESDAPRDSLLGRRAIEDVVGTIRATVVEVIPDRGPGRFGLLAHQTYPRNAFLALVDLQRNLDRGGKVNTVLVAGGTDANADETLRDALRLEDLGLSVTTGDSSLSVQSTEFVLRPTVASAVETVAASLGVPTARIQTYLANEIRVGERVIPYSTITAVDGAGAPPLEPLIGTDGSPAALPGENGIVLNEWAARDLDARLCDELELVYYVVGPREELRTRSARFRL